MARTANFTEMRVPGARFSTAFQSPFCARALGTHNINISGGIICSFRMLRILAAPLHPRARMCDTFATVILLAGEPVDVG